jgi:hypothetical protein
MSATTSEPNAVPVAPVFSLAFMMSLSANLRRRVSLIGMVVFVILSVADLALTAQLLNCRLLVDSNVCVIYESNPVADYILQRHGWSGLITFKLAVVSLVAIIILYISYFRPVTAKRLLTFACALMSAVVVYSTYLMSQLV